MMDYEKQKRCIVHFLYGGLLLFLAFVIIKYGFSLLAPFMLAFLLAYFLKTPARYIAKKTRLGYKPVVLLLVLIFYSTVGILIALLSIKVITAVMALVTALPSVYTSTLEPSLAALFTALEKAIYQMDPAVVTTLNDLASQFIASIGQLVTDLSMRGMSLVSGYATSLPGLFIKILLMMIASFFIAGDYDLLTGFVSRQLSPKTKNFLGRVKEYVVGTLFVCIRSYALIMTLTFAQLALGLTIIGVPNSLLIALTISIFDILPVLGTGGIMIPWVILAAVQGDYRLAIGLLVVYLVITVVRNILEPKIVGSQIGLHPIVTLASMFVGVQLFGIVGLFALPILLSLLGHLNETGAIRLYK